MRVRLAYSLEGATLLRTTESLMGNSATDAAALSASSLDHLALVGHRIFCGNFQLMKK